MLSGSALLTTPKYSLENGVFISCSAHVVAGRTLLIAYGRVSVLSGIRLYFKGSSSERPVVKLGVPVLTYKVGFVSKIIIKLASKHLPSRLIVLSELGDFLLTSQ